MSSVPGAPLPSVGPPSGPSNPWTVFGAVGGCIAVVAGIILILTGNAQQSDYPASPVTTLVGTAILSIGALLLACAFVLAGVNWYLIRSRGDASSGPG